MPQQAYLRVEAVNLGFFIYDNQDLSTVRGGGLLLLDSIRDIEKEFSLKRISVGASIGFFEVELSDGTSANDFSKKVLDWLSVHPNYQHASFVVDTTTSVFSKAREELIACNRWQQMQATSYSIVSTFVPSKSDTKECAIDLVRPGIHKVTNADGKTEWHSDSVHVRREHGRTQKQKLYEDCGVSGLKYSEHFDDLTALPYDSKLPGLLHHKMAVFYADGNSFSKLLQQLCTGAENLETLDKYLRESRKSLMKSLVERARDDVTYSWRVAEVKNGAIRLETLLWGGDELIWVVPAWKGFEVARMFFDETAKWKIPNDLIPEKAHVLTHAAGLVFCSYKAPIHRMTKLAKALAEVAKGKLRHEDRLANVLVVEALESFDVIDDDLDKHLASRSPECSKGETASVRARRLVLEAEKLAEIEKVVTALKRPSADFSRKKHHEVVAGLLSNKEDVRKKGTEAAKTLKALAPEQWQRLANSFGSEEVAWVQAWHLWDYFVAPEVRP